MSVIRIFTDRGHVVWGVIGIVVWPVAFYGIHKRAPGTWKLGFAYIALGGIATLIYALLDKGIPSNVDHRVMVPFVVISIVAVSIYWGYWWYRQRGYFRN